jgi:hypothetical protein
MTGDYLSPPNESAQIRQEFAVSLSISTIKRRLSEHGIHKHIKADRPLLDVYDARRRLAWCHRHRHWGVERWRRVVWSDECSVEKYADPAVQWVFRTSKENGCDDVLGVRGRENICIEKCSN